jgi:hypothetical protein
VRAHASGAFLLDAARLQHRTIGAGNTILVLDVIEQLFDYRTTRSLPCSGAGMWSAWRCSYAGNTATGLYSAETVTGDPTVPLPFRTAITLPGLSASVAETLALARRAESAGYDDLWLADAGGMDALTLAAVLAQNTSRARIGIAVVPAYTRTPAVLASTAATIAQIAPERFILGLGTSSHAIIEGWHGLHLTKPLTRMRETVTLLRQMLAGEKTRFSGETLKSHGYRQEPVAGGVPTLSGGAAPRDARAGGGARRRRDPEPVSARGAGAHRRACADRRRACRQGP